MWQYNMLVCVVVMHAQEEWCEGCIGITCVCSGALRHHSFLFGHCANEKRARSVLIPASASWILLHL